MTLVSPLMLEDVIQDLFFVDAVVPANRLVEHHEAEAVERLREEQLQLIEGFPELALDLPAAIRLEHQRDQVGQGAGEVLLVHTPGSGRAGVLIAQHSDDASFAADGNIQHREDIQDIQIADRELAGVRVGAGVVCRNGPALFQRLEVLRILSDLKNRSALMDIAIAIEKVQAVQFRMVVVEQPDADASHVECIRRDGRDPGQRVTQAGRTGTRNLDQSRLELQRLKIGSQGWRCLTCLLGPANKTLYRSGGAC